MSDRDDLVAALGKLTVEDVSIDPLGRVILKDPDVARLLGRLQGEDGAAMMRSNVGCTTNGALCKPNSMQELRDLTKAGIR